MSHFFNFYSFFFSIALAFFIFLIIMGLLICMEVTYYGIRNQ